MSEPRSRTNRHRRPPERRQVPVDSPVIIVVNKIDQVKDKTQLLPFLARLGAEGDFAAIVPVSAMRGAQLDALLAETRKHPAESGIPLCG
ncbi:hypothetical protein [Accumulibacter sp.]|uniref:hypothetical protein n=1 Tax=Accumulibacter sp. TaxID=2053492 RepID=UPI0025898E56|nr:hypothetical protein [Accumulibacter sp.]